MAGSRFLEKWVGVCRRRTDFYSQLKEEEIDGPVEIVVEILPKDKPGIEMAQLPNNAPQKWYETGLRLTKAQLMNLGFGYIQKCVGVCRRRMKGYFYMEEDEPESETRSEEDEFRSETRSLPVEIVVDILSRTAFKTLLRCRCVCKTWHSLISQPSFIEMQLLKNNHSATNDDEISDYVIFSNKKINFQSLGMDGCVSKKLEFLMKPSFGFRHFVPSGGENFRPYCPWMNPISFLRFNVVGSSNGLLCLLCRKSVILWNPAVNKIRVLEETQMNCFELVGGICYISQTMEFRVVKIGCKYGMNPPEVQVYSTLTNSWKKTAQNNFHRWIICQNCPAPFVEGALHWCAEPLGRGRRADGFYAKHVILCFDVLEEAFREIDVPANKRMERIKEFEGTIAGFRDSPNDRSWEVWIMKEYNVEESWVKLYTVGYINGTPLEIMNNGELMLTGADGEFFLFDPTTETHKREVNLKPGCQDLVAYKGSLALLHEGNKLRICPCCILAIVYILLQCIIMFQAVVSLFQSD